MLCVPSVLTSVTFGVCVTVSGSVSGSTGAAIFINCYNIVLKYNWNVKIEITAQFIYQFQVALLHLQ